jgi:hypothetical protein
MPFPSSVLIGINTYTRESCSDGFVYRVTGITNPHVTIHGVKSDDYWTWLRDGSFHVSYGHGDLYEYRQGDPDPFIGGKKATNKGTYKNDANSLAKKFWDSIRGL